MYISEVTITAYKTFINETTLRCFDGKFTVITGASNSGKTNFLEAIELVLSPDLLTKSHRQEVISKSSNAKTCSVTIVFQGTDRELQEILKNNDEVIVKDTQIRISRIFSAALDIFLINGKGVTRAELKEKLSMLRIPDHGHYMLFQEKLYFTLSKPKYNLLSLIDLFVAEDAKRTAKLKQKKQPFLEAFKDNLMRFEEVFYFFYCLLRPDEKAEIVLIDEHRKVIDFSKDIELLNNVVEVRARPLPHTERELTYQEKIAIILSVELATFRMIRSSIYLVDSMDKYLDKQTRIKLASALNGSFTEESQVVLVSQKKEFLNRGSGVYRCIKFDGETDMERIFDY